jgi:UDP-N-acetylmuramoyl-L-alanyl-D-glutamate--2,6-diaminopimelate ligase
VSAVPLGLLLQGISSVRPRISGDVPSEESHITGIEHDSRQVRPGSLFVCLPGAKSDGHDFAASALKSGAAVIVGERDLGLARYVQVDDSRRALALASCAFHAHPSRRLRLIGVTGTNGKTSICWMLDRMLNEAGQSAAVLGTLGAGTPWSGQSREEQRPAAGAPFRDLGHTTPEANVLQAELARWVEHGVTAGAMEVSSHALVMRRAYGTRFAALVFSNLSTDHLDFHHSMEEYAKAKNLLFRRRERGPDEPPCVAVVNADDPSVEGILEGTDDSILRFGRGPACDVRLRQVFMSRQGIRMQVDFAGAVSNGTLFTPSASAGAEIVSPLLGDFQVENLLAAFATGLALGLAPAVVAAGLGRLRGVPGRMERIDRGQPFSVLVDYAHTPDALRRALRSLRSFTTGQLLLVFGCGGDRDSTKRSLMGRVAAEEADRIVLTDDNPRSEDPAVIRAAIRSGIEEAGGRCVEEGDREAAIRRAILDAAEGDTVLIAGKGHETTQLRGVRSLPFDDRAVAARVLGEGAA